MKSKTASVQAPARTPDPQEVMREREKAWHENLFKERHWNEKDFHVPEAILNRYLHPPKRALFQQERLFQMTGDLRGKTALVFGCGDANSTVILALKGADVWAFDLSEEAVSIQRQMARVNGVSDRVHAIVCPAEQMPFGAGQFDLVLGSAILHHIPNHLPELPEKLHKILKRNGQAIFVEPISRSRVLQRLLALIPFHDELSPGERQLLDEDFLYFRNLFDVEFSYFSFLSRVDRLILRGPLEFSPWWTKLAIYTVHACDYGILNVLGLSRLSGAAVITMRPKQKYAAVAAEK